MDNEYTIVINDFSKNENKDNQDKELEDLGNKEKEMLLSYLDNRIDSFSLLTPLTSMHYLEGSSIYSADIQLPPPQHLI